MSLNNFLEEFENLHLLEQVVYSKGIKELALDSGFKEEIINQKGIDWCIEGILMDGYGMEGEELISKYISLIKEYYKSFVGKIVCKTFGERGLNKGFDIKGEFGVNIIYLGNRVYCFLATSKE